MESNTSPIIKTGNVQSINWSKVAIATIGLIIFGGVCAYAGHEIPARQTYNSPFNNTTSLHSHPSVTPTPSANKLIMYTNTTYGVSLQYPSSITPSNCSIYAPSTPSNKVIQCFANPAINTKSNGDLQDAAQLSVDTLANGKTLQEYVTTAIQNAQNNAKAQGDTVSSYQQSTITLNGVNAIELQSSSIPSNRYAYIPFKNNQVLILAATPDNPATDAFNQILHSLSL